jgi:hypothetical protein
MLVLFAGCLAANTRAIPTTDLYADDGQVKSYDEPIGFAVLGELRPPLPGEETRGRVYDSRAAEEIAKDAGQAFNDGRADFAVLTGNLVRASSVPEWKAFSRAWGTVLGGSEVPEPGQVRVRSLPVAGTEDRQGDERLFGWGAAFPGVGADIGHNRVASWYAIDLVVKKHTWRVLALDTDKARLGSRWQEQLAWIPRAMEGKTYDGIIVLMHHPKFTLAVKGQPDEAGAPTELLDSVEDAARLGTLKLVISGHSGTNEAFLPGGRLGELYLGAGNSGGPAASLARWGAADRANTKDTKLETIFDLALMREFTRANEAKPFNPAVVEHARAEGSYKGFIGEYEAASFPVQGWWLVSINGPGMEVTFRLRLPEGGSRDVYTTEYVPKQGWKIGD